MKSNKIAKRNYTGDAELTLYEERAGWIFDITDLNELRQLFLALPYETRRGKALDRDAPYSCSMRLIRLVYFIRMHDSTKRGALFQEFAPCASRDAAALASALEYKRATVTFSNHLFQNYCALLLYHTQFKDHPYFIDYTNTISTIEQWLEKDWDILFRNNLRLYEGSTTYEILLLPIVCNIACCGYRSPLADRIRQQYAQEVRLIVNDYIINNSIVLPLIGDITPDYSIDVLRMFIATFAFYENTPYRRIWHEDLQQIGL